MEGFGDSTFDLDECRGRQSPPLLSGYCPAKRFATSLSDEDAGITITKAEGHLTFDE